MSSNFSYIHNSTCDADRIFEGLPPNGSFYWKKGINCDKFLSHLPSRWNKFTE